MVKVITKQDACYDAGIKMRMNPGVQRAWFAHAPRRSCRPHLRLTRLLCREGFSFICLILTSEVFFYLSTLPQKFLYLSTLSRRFFF